MNLILMLMPFEKNYIEIVDFVAKLVMGSATSVMIYYLSRWMFTNNFFTLSYRKDKEIEEKQKVKYAKMAETVAFGAAILFNFNQGLIYSVSMYSETLFTWL